MDELPESMLNYFISDPELAPTTPQSRTGKPGISQRTLRGFSAFSAIKSFLLLHSHITLQPTSRKNRLTKSRGLRLTSIGKGRIPVRATFRRLAHQSPSRQIGQLRCLLN
jgi:hypothetical protein